MTERSAKKQRRKSDKAIELSKSDEVGIAKLNRFKKILFPLMIYQPCMEVEIGQKLDLHKKTKKQA